jgi:hypothetical protein
MVSAIRRDARHPPGERTVNESIALMSDGTRKNWRGRIADILRKVYRWSENHVPPGLRLVVGLLLMVGGVFGFLPVLGFWMLPVGAMLVAMDIPPLHRWLRRRLRPHEDDAAEADG